MDKHDNLIAAAKKFVEAKTRARDAYWKALDAAQDQYVRDCLIASTLSQVEEIAQSVGKAVNIIHRIPDRREE